MTGDVETGWQYDAVPPRSWRWTVAEDASLLCQVDKWVDLSPSGLAYAGLCYHPNWGGRYTIGFQTIEAFLTEGELTGDMPGDIAAAIRTHLEAHRRRGPPTVLVLVAVRAAEDPRRLDRVDCSLDGVFLALAPLAGTLGAQLECELFRGSVAAGRHALSAAFVLASGEPRLAYTGEVTVELEAGATRVLRMVLEPGADRVECG